MADSKENAPVEDIDVAPQVDALPAVDDIALEQLHPRRAFHLSWFGFFMAFTAWFAFAPLMPTIKKDLNLTKSEIASANIASVSSTILLRVVVGPLCDRYGPRHVMAYLLLIGAVPVMCGSLVTSANGLIAVRFFIGTIGAVFVPCQMWTTVMFAPVVVGAANALVGGWGNLGGGFTYIFMPSVQEMFEAFGVTTTMAWRVSMLVPGVIAVGVAILILTSSDNWPTDGLQDVYEYEDSCNGCCFHAIRREKTAQEKGIVSPVAHIQPVKPKSVKLADMIKVTANPSVIMMMLAYAACFGVELAVNNAIGLYFYDNFKKEGCDVATDDNECRVMGQGTSGRISSLFGLMNLFARASGGVISDRLSKSFGLHGRLLTQLVCLFGEGIFLLIFSQTTSLAGAIFVLVIMSLFTQASEGSTFAIVPYVDTQNIGAVAGMVGAGGNIGAVVWSSIFKSYADDPRKGFEIVSYIIIGSSVATLLLSVQGKMLVTWAMQICSEKRTKVQAKRVPSLEIEMDGIDGMTPRAHRGPSPTSQSPASLDIVAGKVISRFQGMSLDRQEEAMRKMAAILFNKRSRVAAARNVNSAKKKRATPVAEDEHKEREENRNTRALDLASSEKLRTGRDSQSVATAMFPVTAEHRIAQRKESGQDPASASVGTAMYPYTAHVGANRGRVEFGASAPSPHENQSVPQYR